jgi:single-strand DNA-binding protein
MTIKATAIGNLGQDAQLKHLQDGTAILEFSVGTRGEKDRNTQEAKTEWVRCSLWGKRGESLVQYLTKGRYVVVSGTLSVRTYDKDGQTRISVDLKADDVSMGPQPQSSGEQAPQQRQAPPQQQPQYRQPPPQQQAPQGQQRRANF